MSFLIDTDLLSFLRRRGRSRKLERFVAAHEAEIFVSVVTWAEIEYGITLTDEAFQKDLHRWIATVRAQFAGATLPLDEAVLVRWKQLLAALSLAGTGKSLESYPADSEPPQMGYRSEKGNPMPPGRTPLVEIRLQPRLLQQFGKPFFRGPHHFRVR
jgi:predicted nucleic acid-binding protein